MVAFRARLIAFLAMVLVAVPVAVAGSVQYFCHGMGMLMPACCCGSDAVVIAPRSCGPRFEPRQCCERLERAPSALAPALRDPAWFPDFVASVGALATASVPAIAESGVLVAEAVRAREPQPRGPPIFLQNCALLI